MSSQLGGPVLQSAQAAGARQFFSNLPAHGDPGYVIYYNDFLANQDFPASDWVITTVGGAQQILAPNERGGALQLSSPAVNGDSSAMQLVDNNYQFNAGTRVWFESRVRLNATNALFTFFVGLMEPSADPNTTNNFSGWEIRTNDARPRATTAQGGNVQAAFSATAAQSGVFTHLGFFYDGKGGVDFFHNRVLANKFSTLIPFDIALRPTLFLQNDDASARGAAIDYLFICVER